MKKKAWVMALYIDPDVRPEIEKAARGERRTCSNWATNLVMNEIDRLRKDEVSEP